MSQELKNRLCDTVKLWKDLEVPYQHRGITRNGCDCTGLIIGALKELGYLKNYKLRNYSPDWNLHSKANNYIEEEISKYADKITWPDFGDLVLFHFGRCVAHIGVIIENGLIIHCHRKSNKVTASRLGHSQWGKRVSSFYRIDEAKL